VVFSPDGSRAAYHVVQDGQHLIVVGEQEFGPYKRMGKTGIGFLPGSGRVFYSVRRGDKEALVVEGLEGPACELFRSLSYSADGERYAYAAQKGPQAWTVVIDGVEYGPDGKIEPGRERCYEFLGKRTPVISPDGKHIAYAARRNGRSVIVRDGVEGAEFNLIMRGTVDFTPDSEHIVYIAARGDKRFLVVDELEIEHGWDGFLQNTDFVFEGPRRFHIRGSKNPRFVLIEVEIL
jgi:Tol biopolymer transport system component